MDQLLVALAKELDVYLEVVLVEECRVQLVLVQDAKCAKVAMELDSKAVGKVLVEVAVGMDSCFLGNFGYLLSFLELFLSLRVL
jgi:hypothetical protein